MDLFLPRPYNVVRKVVDAACAGIGLVPRVVAEIESASTLASVIAAGMGVTILPELHGEAGRGASTSAWHARIIDPAIEVPLALCQSDHLPLSEPAVAIRQILLELVRELPGNLLSPEDVKPPEENISRPYGHRDNLSWSPNWVTASVEDIGSSR